MNKIHITLVGGQPMPVYLGIKHCSPDNIIFVYSKDSEKQKQILKNEYKDKVLKSDPLDPVNVEEIEKRAILYSEKYKDYEVTLNISGGTKAWAYYFSKVFEPLPNAKIIYVDQNNIVYDLKSKTSEKVHFEFMKQFELHKNPLLSYREFKYFTNDDLLAIKEIKRIRNIDIGIFTELTNMDLRKSQKIKNQETDTIISRDGSKLILHEPTLCEFEIKKSNEIKKESVTSTHISEIIFNAGWFELQVAEILSRWEKTKNIYMNCKFLVNQENIDIKKAEQTPKNEVDIIIDTGDKALFVECKTSIKNSTDIDKFNSVVKTYGGSGSKAIVICLNKIGDKENEKIRDSNMLSYSFSNSKDIQELYALLDRKILGINK